MNRDLDGIYLRIKRDGKWQDLCLSDMTEKELKENLKFWTAENLFRSSNTPCHKAQNDWRTA